MEASCRHLQAAACPAHSPLPPLVFKTHFATEHGAPFALGAGSGGSDGHQEGLGCGHREKPSGTVPAFEAPGALPREPLGREQTGARGCHPPPEFCYGAGAEPVGPRGDTDFSRLLVGTRAGASGSLSAIVGRHRLAQLASIAWPRRTGEALSAGVWPSAFAGGEGGERAEAGRAWAGGREQEKVHRVGGSQEPSLTCPSCLARLDNSSIFVVPTPCQVGVWVAMFVQ